MADGPATDLLREPATTLARRLRSRELHARELVAASLHRIEALDPTINAFVDVFADEALAEAEAIAPGDPRPFAGIPIAIKNNRAVAGRRLTCGAQLPGDVPADADHNVVARLRRAGFVIVGTTTMPEWGILPTTESRRLGPTRNPWDQSRTPGGSSGGSAAAVAAGMVPLAHGNDGGGSLRIPAACCGLVGLKPQRNRISPAPDIGHAFLVQDGVLTRTVADTAALLDLLAGAELGDVSWAPPPAEPFARTAARPPGRCRIAVTTTPPLAGAEVDPAREQAVQDAARLLEGLGHDVVEAEPPWTDDPTVLRAFTAVFGPAVCTTIATAAARLGRPLEPGDVEALSWAVWTRCQELDATRALLAEFRLHRLTRTITTWMSPYDALLTPALAEAPLPLGTLDPLDDRDPWGTFARSGRFTPFTAIFNVTGQPAVSLPLFTDDAGLPLAVQLVGRPAGEGDLLALAAQLEDAAPWAARRPPL